MNNPAFRPDVTNSMVSQNENPGPDDIFLNSLSQFDLLYCLLIILEGNNEKSFYPASSAFSQKRVEPVANLIIQDAAARRALFPNATDRDLSKALIQCWRLAEYQATQIGGNWWDLPAPVSAFVVSSGVSEDSVPKYRA